MFWLFFCRFRERVNFFNLSSIYLINSNCIPIPSIKSHPTLIQSCAKECCAGLIDSAIKISEMWDKKTEQLSLAGSHYLYLFMSGLIGGLDMLRCCPDEYDVLLESEGCPDDDDFLLDPEDSGWGWGLGLGLDLDLEWDFCWGSIA